MSIVIVSGKWNNSRVCPNDEKIEGINPESRFIVQSYGMGKSMIPSNPPNYYQKEYTEYSVSTEEDAYKLMEYLKQLEEKRTTASPYLKVCNIWENWLVRQNKKFTGSPKIDISSIDPSKIKKINIPSFDTPLIIVKTY